MIAKNNPLTRELPKRGSVLLAHKIRTHSIPRDDDHMALGFRRYDRCSRRADDEKQK